MDCAGLGCNSFRRQSNIINDLINEKTELEKCVDEQRELIDKLQKQQTKEGETKNDN